MEDFNKYKYQIDIDGNTNSWPGLFQKLLTRSPVLKVASPRGYRQWYYDRLRPWVNFVPVAQDMSDLIEKILWLRSHDDAGRRIGEAGKALADSLDYEGEIARSGRVVTAALRYFAGAPELTFRFGAGESDNRFLREGWEDPVAGCVWAHGCVSSVVAPRPVSRSDFDVSLEVGPVLAAPTGPGQELGIVVNGRLLCQAEVVARTTLACRIPAELIEQFDELTVTLLHPRVVALASVDQPCDRRTGSIAVFALTLTAARPRKLTLFPVSPAGAMGCAVPIYLLTHHGGLVGADDGGRLMQVDATDAARNRLVAFSGPPHGRLIESGPLVGFTATYTEDAVYFRKDERFLCAEPHGVLVADREHAGPWERFSLVSETAS